MADFPAFPHRPNVIWVFGDQHRGQSLGFAGDPNVHTPEIDRLASDGFATSRAVAGCPLCCPYRGSLLTSRYPHEAVPAHQAQMPPEMTTVAHAFSGAGYETAWFGKWHLDGFQESQGRAAHHTVPPARRGGFDTWIGYENNNAQWDCWVHGHDLSGREIPHQRLDGYETDALTDLLVEFVRHRGGEGQAPFFAGLSVQPPHDPYVAPADWMRRHTPADVSLRANVPAIERVREGARRELAGYHAMIENLDWNLGRVRRALDEAGLADDTIIVFFSDHGDMHGSHGQFRKTSPWEEAIRVPFVVGGPSRYLVRAGWGPALVNHVDVAPTTLGLCGIEPPAEWRGRDLSGLYRPDKPRPEMPASAFLQLVTPTRHPNSVDRPFRGVVTRDGWKYVCLEGQPWLLFDLNEDPYEQANHAHNSAYGAKRRELQQELAGWIAEAGDEFPLPEL